MKNADPRVLLRRIPDKWRLPVMTGVGILWLGLLAGLGWFFLGEHKPEQIIINAKQMDKSPVAEWKALKLFYQAALHDIPVQLVSGEKSVSKYISPVNYLKLLQEIRLNPSVLMARLRTESPEYLIPNNRYDTRTAYEIFGRQAEGMSMNKLLEAGSQSGIIWLDKEFMDDFDLETDDDGSMLICGDSREGEVCLAFLDRHYKQRAEGNGSLRPDYLFIAATGSEDSARQEIAFYKRLMADLPRVFGALSQDGLRAVSVENVELRRNEKKSAPACLVDVTVANTDPGQRDVEGIDFHCYILDTHGKPVELVRIWGNERQRISAGRRARTYTLDLDGIGDARSRRLIKLLEGSYQLKIIPYARRLDGKETRELGSGSLPQGVVFQNGVWRYNNTPLSLEDVSPLLTVNQQYAAADDERLKAEMEARQPAILRLATWVHNKTMRSLVSGPPKITFKKMDRSILHLTLTNTDAHKLLEATLVFVFANAEGYPCQVMRFRAHNLESGKKENMSLNLSDKLPYFLLQEVQRGNVNLSIFAHDITYFDLYPTSVLKQQDGKLQADAPAFYQRNGVWYYNGTALPAEAAECTEAPLLEPDVSPEDEEDLKARYARHQNWFNEQRNRLAPLVFSRFVPLIHDSWYRSVDRVRDGLWIDTTGDRDIWMLENRRIPDAVVQDAGLEAWPRNEARKGSSETEHASPAAPAAPAAPTEEDVTPENPSGVENSTPATPAVASEAAIAPSTPDSVQQTAASTPSRENITAEVSLANSTAAHKVVFAIHFRNTAGQDAQVSYRTFFFESGKMFGRRESKMTIRVPAQGEQILHLGSNKPELIDIGRRMQEGKVQMLVEIVDVEAAK